MSSSSASKPKKEKTAVEVVIFEDPDKRKKKATPKEAPKKQKPKSSLHFERPVFDQRMAKFDIHKLAMTGMQEEDKEEAMVNYLVELGAKRPKGKAIPLKDYIQELKKRKQDGDTNDDGPDKKQQKRKKRDKKDIFVDGQIGKWKRGVQFINTGKKLQKRV